MKKLILICIVGGIALFGYEAWVDQQAAKDRLHAQCESDKEQLAIALTPPVEQTERIAQLQELVRISCGEKQ
jgi:hypothetical protein